MTPRTHLVTGAGAGIGAALAGLLSARGDRVVTLTRSDERAEEVRAVLGDRHDVRTCDLADLQQVAEVGAAVARDLGTLDSVVHCAGVVDLGAVADLDLAAWQRQLTVNLTAPAVLTSAVLPAVRAARGTVVMVNSTAGVTANAHWAAYAASKHGLRAFADALRAEEAAHGVRVTTVFPSRTATQMQAKVHLQEGRAYDEGLWMQPHSVAASVLHVLDLPADATMTELTIRTSPSPT